MVGHGVFVVGVFVVRQLVLVNWGSRFMISRSWASSEMPWKSWRGVYGASRARISSSWSSDAEGLDGVVDLRGAAGAEAVRTADIRASAHKTPCDTPPLFSHA